MKNIRHFILCCIALSSCKLTICLANNYWKCHAEDSSHAQWTEISSYQRMANSKAFDACRKQSRLPNSCKTIIEDCEFFINGTSTRPLWQCTALDEIGDRWQSVTKADQYDAMLNAKENCKRNSSIPDSCYMNVLMCKNDNDLS